MKITGSHTSATHLTKELLNDLDRSIPNLKVSLGPILSARSGRSGNSRIKILTVKAGLRLKLTHNSSTQQIYLYTNQSDILIDKITSFCTTNKVELLDL